MDPQFDTAPTKNIDLYIAMCEAFLYGAYAVMFGFYIHVLHTRGIPKTRFLPVATILLFILCTVHMTLLVASIAVRDQTDETSVVGAGDPSYLVLQLNFATSVIYVTNNVIADSIFLFRCHAIWNYDDRIVFLPVLLTFGVGGLGYFDSGRSIVVSRPLFNLSIATSVFTTFILISLSAGRIWWLARKARDVLGQKITTRYNTVCVMILESGSLYCVGGIVYIILSLRLNNEPMTSAFVWTNGAILGQLVGIAPTIIAVRVGLGLGKSIESVNSFKATEQQPVAPREIQNAAAPVHSIQDQILYLQPESEFV
ncbi:hypothetical protein GGX14DRAFT_466645 [Mycena pura]|uniref:Uncharacterized protein n=1 Tax=Mycena pura TaxID=153505 RepID=A0AAD6V5T7_9AGAR|nr:hypothetical protein GGX14DRAFT_466645 [Mycena pura]